MGLVSPGPTLALRAPDSAAPGPAQARIIEAALKLFAIHGVGGTSLQMIASEIGVTKAAVYHQYRTKAEIIQAVAEAELDRLESALDSAEADGGADAARRRQAVLERIVDLAVERRRQVGTLLNDPVIGRLYAKDERLLAVLGRLNDLLMGPGAGPQSRLATAMLTAAISGAVIHPLVAGQNDAALRAQLVLLMGRLLELPA